MAEPRRAMNRAITVKTHHDLTQVTETQLRENCVEILRDADHGIQTAVVSQDGRVMAVVGLNGIRYLPDPDPDPLDEIVDLVLDASRSGA